MPDYAIFWEWLSFAVRWTHVITAIAWIGSSFYFIALDLGLRKTPSLLWTRVPVKIQLDAYPDLRLLGVLNRIAICYTVTGLLFVAMLFDTLDGRVARLTSTESEFGKQYDSLADMVSFGVAPALVAYQWGVARLFEYGSAWGRLGWLAAFFYSVCAALRLARFNTRAAADKRYFEGLPSPSAAAMATMSVR